MGQTKSAVPVAVRDLPRDVRDAIDMYVPRGIPAQSAHYYIQAEYVRLLRGRAQAERNSFRWERTINELKKAFPDLCVKDVTNYVAENCYQADILLHAGYELSDDPRDLLGSLRKGVRIASIHASFIAPTWWMGVRKITRNGSNGANEEWEWPQRTPAQKIRLVADEVLGMQGWKRLSNDQVRQRIANVQLKSLSPGQARVGHILFSEDIEFP
jgi:hypothetical protein